MQADEPFELAKLDPEYVQAYRDACRDGKRNVCQSRVMIVGHYGAGKTSLLRCLLKEPFIEQHVPTIGINADPNETKVVIARSKNWTHSKETNSSYVNEIAQLVIEKQQQSSKGTKQPAKLVSPKQSEKPSQQRKAKLHETAALVTDVAHDPIPQKHTSSIHLDPLVHKHQPGADRKRDRKDHDDRLPVHAGSPTDRTNDPTAIGHPHDESCPPEIAKQVAKLSKNKDASSNEELFFWDFGGQGLSYSTHQIFLNSRGIYIIVLDLTKGLDHKLQQTLTDRLGRDVVDSTHEQTVGDLLDYWMSCIYSQVKDEDRKKDHSNPKCPPVIIVCTHKDQYLGNVENYKAEILQFLEEKDYNVHTFAEIFTVSTPSHDGDDIKCLRNVLEDLAKEEKYAVPLTWFKLKDSMKKADKKCLKHAEFENMAKEAGLKSMQDAEAALGFFHAVGDLVYFKEMPDFIVTHPQWLIDQFSKVIMIKNEDDPMTDKMRAQLDNHGILSEGLLDHIWRDEIERETIVKFMIQFAMLLPVGEDYLKRNPKMNKGKGKKTYLVPALLPPAEVRPFHEAEKPLTLKPVCNFIPAGLPGRLFTSLSTKKDWKICGHMDVREAEFRTSDGCKFQIRTKLSKALLVVVGFKLDQKDEKTFKMSLKQIAETLEELPGTVEFDICIKCNDCSSLKRLGPLENIEDIVKENPEICDSHDGPRILGSDYAVWFSDPVQQVKKKTLEGETLEEEKVFKKPELDKATSRWLLNARDIAAKVRDELETDQVRCHIEVEGTLERLIDQWKIIGYDVIEQVKAEKTRPNKMGVLIDKLQRCSDGRLLLFARALARVDQLHQLKSLTPNERKSITEGDDAMIVDRWHQMV